jgi:flavin reductase (DIM6/NTAB) family NADH-FMN oxidoreductase RutF
VKEIQALFRCLSAGVYIVGTGHGEKRSAFTAAWITQVSYDPLLVVVSINPRHATYPVLIASRAFAISVLKAGQVELARRFGTRSGRDEDKLAGLGWHPAQSGAPVLTEALAYLDCELTHIVPAGDHELVIARVVAGEILDPNATPMTYAETGDMDGGSSLYPARF